MRVRGRRRCKDCGTEWSYFETGEIACPDCGSHHSVGIDRDRSLHTDTPVELDLSAARSMVDARPLGDVARTAAETARAYVVRRGFIVGGDLTPLDDRFLHAAELWQVGTALRHGLETTDAAEAYFLALLDGTTDPGPVPQALEQAHGLARVAAAEAYASDLRKWLDDHPDQAAHECLERLRDHIRRANALDGDIPPESADRLTSAARGLGGYLRTGDEGSLETVRTVLDRVD